MRGGNEPCMDPVNANGVRLRTGGPHLGRVLSTATYNAYQGDIVVYSDDGPRSPPSSSTARGKLVDLRQPPLSLGSNSGPGAGGSWDQVGVRGTTPRRCTSRVLRAALVMTATGPRCARAASAVPTGRRCAIAGTRTPRALRQRRRA
jgi:hypothetical protein